MLAIANSVWYNARVDVEGLDEWETPTLFLAMFREGNFLTVECVFVSKIIDTVTALAAPIAAKNGCELWDVEYVKEAGLWYLRVYIDRPEGVSISHCEAVSRDLDPVLDEHEDLIPGSYTFEVSSAGAERRLKRASDFDRFTGHLVEIKLYKSRNGQKTFAGTLDGLCDGVVKLTVSDRSEEFNMADIASARLRLSMEDYLYER